VKEGENERKKERKKERKRERQSKKLLQQVRLREREAREKD